MSESKAEYSTQELKPCPFCGNTDIRDATLSDGEWLVCMDCEGNSGKNGKDGWNTRPTEAAAERRGYLKALDDVDDKVKTDIGDVNDFWRFGDVVDKLRRKMERE